MSEAKFNIMSRGCVAVDIIIHALSKPSVNSSLTPFPPFFLDQPTLRSTPQISLGLVWLVLVLGLTM
jgi:hypothetical protein